MPPPATTERLVDRPDDFALATAWQQVVGEVEQHRSRMWATVLVETRFVPVLRNQFGRHCRTDGELDDGRSRVRLGAELVERYGLYSPSE